MMLYLLDRARERGLTEVWLEVIEANTAAYQLYCQLGFELVRYLLILERDAKAQLPEAVSPYTVTDYPVEVLLQHYDRFHDVPNSWQRARASLKALIPHIEGWAALDHEQIVALGWGKPY
jgi:hypothetical protein